MIKPLLVEDNPGDVQIIEELLQGEASEKIDLTHTDTLHHAQDLLQTHSFDLIILDLSLPDSQGLVTLEQIQKTWNCPPIIVLSGNSDENVALQAVQQGAQDYVLKKNCNEAALHRAIRHSMERHRLLKRLEEAGELLFQKTQGLQRFYQQASHELKTPLTSTREFICILLEGMAGDLNDTQLEYLQVAKDSCDQLNKLINDLLDTAKLETAKLKISTRMISIEHLVNQALATMYPIAKKKEITLNHSFQSGLPELLIDDIRVMQVLTNVLGNALKFTPTGGTIGLSMSEKDGQWVEISIKDSGPGIPQDQIDSIFDRLNQGESEQTNIGEGLGLGLFISREIVRLHGGTITAESEDGKGTTITFTLPYPHLSNRVNRPYLLIIDDEESIRSLLQTAMSTAGFRIKTACDGTEALDVIHDETPDLLIVDLMMPVMDGPTLLREVRNAIGTIPTIVLTGFPKSDLVNQAMVGTSLTLIDKPCELEFLIETIRGILNMSRRTQTSSLELGESLQ